MYYCFSKFYSITKKFVKDSSVSDENFCNALINVLINTSSIKNRYNEEIYLTKSRVSRLINGKDDIPTKIKAILDNSSTSSSTKEEFYKFLDANISRSRLIELKDELNETINSSNNVDKSEITVIKNSICNNKELVFNAFIISLRKSNKYIAENKILYENGTNKIIQIDGDLFNTETTVKGKEKAIVVIPVNTGFDVHITREHENDLKPLVSEKTIHGYWLNKMYKAGFDENKINILITESLQSLNIKPIAKSKSKNGNKEIYQIGTIAVISYKKVIYYLLAISNFDENNKAHSSKEDLINSIEKLVKFYDDYGQRYKMFIPLIGTGGSRAKLNYKESLDLIVNTLTKNIEYINGEIYIVDKDGNLGGNKN